VVGFVTVTEGKEQQLTVSELDAAGGVVTLKERVMQTAAFKEFQQAVENKVGPNVRTPGQ
jgi:fructose-specific phosphotransferase system component IIB